MPSCGSHVGIRQDEQGCYLLSVDGIAYRICPGSQVSCDPNGLGIIIDGVLCPFPSGGDGEGNVVTSLAFDTEQLVLTLEQSDGPTFNVDLSMLASDFYADGVSFDVDTRELTITRTGGLDPLTVNIPAGDSWTPPEGEEGQVLGYDSDGEVVALNLPEVLVGDDLQYYGWTEDGEAVTKDMPLVLFHPTFFVRPDGEASPNIRSQDDLATNSFNGFPAVWAFIREHVVHGAVTVDARGTYPGMQLSPASSIAGVDYLFIQGDPDDVTAFTINVSTSGLGLSLNGGRVNLHDTTFVIPEGAEGLNTSPITIQEPAEGTLLQLEGHIAITGGANAEMRSLVYAYSGRIRLNGCRITLDLDPTCHLKSVFYVQNAGEIGSNRGTIVDYGTPFSIDAIVYVESNAQFGSLGSTTHWSFEGTLPVVENSIITESGAHVRQALTHMSMGAVDVDGNDAIPLFAPITSVNGQTTPFGEEGQVVGYDEDGIMTAVDLPEPPADEDHYVESASFDEETRVLTLTRTDPLGPLTATITSDATELPEGDPFDVIQYDADGEPVAGKVAPQNLTHTAIPSGEQLGPFSVPGIRSIVGDTFYWLPATHINWQPDQYSIAVRDRDGTLKAAPAEDPDDLTTLGQLTEAYPVAPVFPDYLDPITGGWARRTAPEAIDARAIAVGMGALAEVNGCTAVGPNSRANGTNALALGGSAKVTGRDAEGDETDSQTQFGIAIGGSAWSYAQGGIAIGRAAQAGFFNSVAIGQFSRSYDAHTVSFGAEPGDVSNFPDGLYRRLTHLDDGVDDNDAVTVGQLNEHLGFYGSVATPTQPITNLDVTGEHHNPDAFQSISYTNDTPYPQILKCEVVYREQYELHGNGRIISRHQFKSNGGSWGTNHRPEERQGLPVDTLEVSSDREVYFVTLEVAPGATVTLEARVIVLVTEAFETGSTLTSHVQINALAIPAIFQPLDPGPPNDWV